jgi:septation ring formation regulator EzrA
MPIKLNLLAEAQLEEEMRRKDPVRYSIYCAVGIILAFGIWIGTNQMLISSKERDVKSLTTMFEQMKPQYNLVLSNMAKINELNQRLNLLTNYVTNRFLWGNVLNALQQCMTNVSTDIQFTRFRTEQNFQVTSPSVVTKGDKKVVIPGSSVEKIKFIIEAKDYGKEEDDNITKLREAIAEFPYFKQRLDKSRGVRLESMSPRISDAANPGRTYVVFTLECQFPDITRE